MVSVASASVADHSILDLPLNIAQMYSSNAFGQCAYLSCLHNPIIHRDIDTWVIGRGDGRGHGSAAFYAFCGHHGAVPPGRRQRNAN